MKSENSDTLNKDISKQILTFALPLAATGILQQLFSAADIAVVGRYVNKNAMAAVGGSVPLITLIINLFVGLSIGANVVISRFLGMKKNKEVKKAVHTALLIAVISGVIMGIICEIAAENLLGLMSIPDDVFDMALLYLRVYFAGMPAILLYDFASAIFRSRGNTRIPLICLMTSGIVNVLLNLFFVIVLKMTVNGVALATVIANVISSSMLIWFLVHEKSEITVSLKDLKIDGRMLKETIRIGLPAGIQGMVFSLSNVVIQSSINELGSDAMAGSSAAFNIEVFVYYVINSFGQACTTFTGQNYGANNPVRCRKTLRIALLQTMIITIMLSLITVAFGRPLLSIFNKSDKIIDIGMIRLKYILLTEFINVIIELFSGCMRGYGCSFVPALTCMIGICGVRIGWVYTIFKTHKTFSALMAAYPLSWAITAFVMIIAYIVICRTKLKNFFANKSLQKNTV